MAKQLIKDRYTKELGKIGARVEKFRTAKKLSQKKLALFSEVPFSSINAIERGDLNPTIGTLLAIAEALEVKPKELLDY